MSPVEFLVKFFTNLWVIVLGVIAVVGVILGLTFGGYLFAHNVAAPLGKNLAQQRANNDYAVTKDSQAYQDTYHSQTDKAYQQIAADKYTLAQDKAQGNGPSSGVIQGDYANITNDISMFCHAAGNLTQPTLDTLGPNELRFYQANC